MKFTIMLTLIILAVSCGKKNESGKPSNRYIDPLTMEQENLIITDFIREGQDVLIRYESALKAMFGFRIVGLIRNRLKFYNVVVTERPLMNDRKQYCRSLNQNHLITLYVGSEWPRLSWQNFHKKPSPTYTRLVMHELLLLGDIDDRDFYYTDKILIPVRR